MKLNRQGQSRILDTNELDSLIDCLPTTKHKLIALVCRRTACRISESIQLRWENVMPGVLFFPIEIVKNKLSPRSIPISEDFEDYAKNVSEKIKEAGMSSIVDLKNHNLNYKIRDHSLAKIPLLIICGKKEVDSNSVTIRRLDSNKQENMELNSFLKKFSALNKAPSNI